MYESPLAPCQPSGPTLEPLDVVRKHLVPAVPRHHTTHGTGLLLRDPSAARQAKTRAAVAETEELPVTQHRLGEGQCEISADGDLMRRGQRE